MSRFVVHFMKDVLGGNGRQREVCQVFLQALGHGREGRERQSSRDDCTDYRNGFCCSLSEALFRHAEVEVGV